MDPMSQAERKNRVKIPIRIQVRVLFRDGWICHWCGYPTVFPLALKYIETHVESAGYKRPLAYYDLRYRHDKALLLDYLAAVIDHIEPYSKSHLNEENNLVTACNKCNSRKSDTDADGFVVKHPRKAVKARYGNPTDWDGFASLFVILGRQNESRLTLQEKKWLKEIEPYLGSNTTSKA